jgi:hypothetical protein
MTANKNTLVVWHYITCPARMWRIGTELTNMTQLTNNHCNKKKKMYKNSRKILTLAWTQLVKKLPAFYRTWRLFTTFTRALHLSLSSDSWKNIMHIKMLSIIYLHWYNTFTFTASFHNRHHLFCSAGCHLHN